MPQILSRRDMLWGTSLGLFCYGYAWYFLLSWLPYYLVIERHFSMRAMALFGALPFGASALSALVAGWASDRLIARGTSALPGFGKGFVVSGMLLCTLVLPAAMVRDSSVAVLLLIVSCLAIGLCSSNVWATTQTLAGRAAAGKWSGMQNAAGNFGGVVSPLLTGLIVSRTHSFLLAFRIFAAVMLHARRWVLFVLWWAKYRRFAWQAEEGTTTVA